MAGWIIFYVIFTFYLLDMIWSWVAQIRIKIKCLRRKFTPLTLDKCVQSRLVYNLFEHNNRTSLSMSIY